MRRTWKWGYAEKKYDYELEGGAVWIENYYFSVYTQLAPLSFGVHSLMWDGVPFWILSLGKLGVSWGKNGCWVLIKNAIVHRSQRF